MIVKIIKNLENKKEKTQESINKDLEELKINIERQTTKLLYSVLPEVISIILSSSSLIHSSASDILLLIPSGVFLISVI